MMSNPKAHASDADILLHIARNEQLSKTLEAFPGLSLEELRQRLTKLAEGMTVPASAGGVGLPTSVATRVRVYSDGAARGNPGPAGAGAVLVAPNGQIIDRLGKFLGVQTNNYAEYMGLLLGLQRAQELGVKEVEVYADSELMIRQLGGRYQVKSPTLRPLYEEAMSFLKEFSRVKLVHVPREMNAAADEMSNRAIDEKM
jgi:ribonuclease HI